MPNPHTIIAVPLKPALAVTLAAVAIVIATSGLQERFGASVAPTRACALIAGDVSILPQPFDPSRAPLAIRVPLAKPARDAAVTIRMEDATVASISLDVAAQGATGIWNGRDVLGAFVPMGTYMLDVAVTNGTCTDTRTTSVTVRPTMHAFVVLDVGATLQLGATLPDDGQPLTTGTWRSSDPDVLTVDAEGVATAKQPGDVTVLRMDSGTPATATQPIAIQVR